ncbi:MFS family permease [Streptosporangium becharense]|uniref:MFS family permease n=1 Tax=Streptosporangium becharense TaxID=1816182 RepID=A0A7W9MKG7_9ACTN|nr:MFS transporter [Streptosporangium becharense]MBB2914350.1 MFS family permease [Streptosporangium becharense]MBB5823618.1 MFS family permease [Streptosporangium becharense]
MTPPNPPAEPPEAVAEALLAGREELIASAAPPQNPPRVGAWTITVYALTMFGFQLTLLLPTLFSLAYKVQLIDPANKDASLGFVLGLGGLISLVVSLPAGVLSDGTRLGWGRRRPFLAAGLVLSALGALIIAVAPTITVMLAGYVVVGVANAAIGTAVNPFLAEQVPAEQRGKVGALGGVTAAVAGVGATLLGSFLTASIYVLFLTPVAVLGVAALLYLLVIPDRPAPEDMRVGSILDVFKNIWFNPLKHPDFALVWLGKFCLSFGSTFFSTYQLYLLQDRLGLTPEQAGRQLAAVGGLSLLALVGSSIAGGTLSDRFKRRKPFIYLATGLIVAGLAVAASAPSMLLFAVGGVLLSAGTGAFNSVDLALASDVMPEKDKAGKYMNIYYLSGTLAGVLAPLMASVILRLGGGGNYGVLFLSGAVLGLGAVVTTAKIRSVR